MTVLNPIVGGSSKVKMLIANAESAIKINTIPTIFKIFFFINFTPPFKFIFTMPFIIITAFYGIYTQVHYTIIEKSMQLYYA